MSLEWNSWLILAEKLSESLRLAQPWPTVQAQVFLCFRVLLLRTSHQHVTSLWPSVITETVQVLSQMEHELRRESDEFRWYSYQVFALDDQFNILWAFTHIICWNLQWRVPTNRHWNRYIVHKCSYWFLLFCSFPLQFGQAILPTYRKSFEGSETSWQQCRGILISL